MTDDQKEKIQVMRRQGMGYVQIASVLCISKETIKSYCKRNHVQASAKVAAYKDSAPVLEVGSCKHCGKIINQIPKQKPKKFCSDQCRLAWWGGNQDRLNRKAVDILTCAHCGREFESYSSIPRKYCGHACYINKRFEKKGNEDVKRPV